MALLILGESVVIALLGGRDRHRAHLPGGGGFAEQMGTLFPIFFVSEQTVLMQVGAALLVGVIARRDAAGDGRAARVRIVDGLRAVG